MNIVKKLLRKRVIIPLFILIILGSIGLYIYKYYKNSMTGEERFICEMVFIDELSEVADQLDTTVSLYYNGNLDEEAYLTQMNMIDGEMAIFMDRVNKFDYGVQVRIGTHTLASKRGTDSAHNIYNLFNDLVDYCMEESNYKDKNKLIYMYIAQKDKIRNESAEFNKCATAEMWKKYNEDKEGFKKYLEEKYHTSTDAEESEE